MPDDIDEADLGSGHVFALVPVQSPGLSAIPAAPDMGGKFRSRTRDADVAFTPVRIRGHHRTRRGRASAASFAPARSRDAADDALNAPPSGR